jgi:hypothetical protein
MNRLSPYKVGDNWRYLLDLIREKEGERVRGAAR